MILGPIFDRLCVPTDPGPVIRIGGNSAEDSCFVPDGHAAPASTHCVQNITMGDLGAYKRFAELSPNCSFVIDTNLMQVRLGSLFSLLCSVSLAFCTHLRWNMADRRGILQWRRRMFVRLGRPGSGRTSPR